MIHISRKLFKLLYEECEDAFKVLMYLYAHSDSNGEITISSSLLCNSLGITRQRFRTSIERLVGFGLIESPRSNRHTSIFKITNQQPTNNQPITNSTTDNQSVIEKNNQPITNQQPTDNQQGVFEGLVEYLQPTNNQLDASFSGSYEYLQPTNNQPTLFEKENKQDKESSSPLTPIIKEKEINKEKEKEKIIIKESEKPKVLRFVPPTVEEVREYIKDKGYNVDAEQWWNFYDSKGWMIGKNKMKKWRSAVATWARGNNNNSYGKQSYQSRKDDEARQRMQGYIAVMQGFREHKEEPNLPF